MTPKTASQRIAELERTVESQARHITILVMDRRRQLPADVLADIANAHTERDRAQQGEADQHFDLLVAKEECERMRAALVKISAIRDSIVGMQGFNFSEHAYPLVAALKDAGFEGAGYEIAHANLGTLIEQTKAAERQRDSATAQVEALRVENERLRAEFLDADAVTAERDSLRRLLGEALGIAKQAAHNHDQPRSHWDDRVAAIKAEAGIE